LNPKEKQELDSRLNAVGLLPLVNRTTRNDPDEIRSFFRAVSRLLQLPAGGASPMALMIDYTEHLAPAVQTSAAAQDEQTFVSESLHMLANAPALRKSKNLLLCLVREGFQNTLLNDLYRVEWPFPDEALLRRFLEISLTCKEWGAPKYSPLDRDLTIEDLARINRGLRLRDVESMLREATAEHRPLSRARVLEAKSRAILHASEGTLSVMSTDLTLDDIVGLEAAKRFFWRVAEKLKAGDPSSPRGILMVGPPGTAKSSFAPILGGMCGFNVLKFSTVKSMWYGESERRLRLALSLVETLAPAVLFIDELTESTPNRQGPTTDSGVSLDLLAQLLQFSARDELRGRVLLLGASNVPERLDPAWHDRFITIPFLELLPHELRQLLAVFERRMTGRVTLDPDDPKVIEACNQLHLKGVSPRKVLDILNHALLFSKDSLTSDDILWAATDYTGSTNPRAVAYCSLVSIALTSFHAYLPWNLNPENYIYPWYLEGLVDKKTGQLDRAALYQRIEETRKYVNL
jgi:SpoVK/Ycf46/Vps4 family AAA+-type ATPase